MRVSHLIGLCVVVGYITETISNRDVLGVEISPEHAEVQTIFGEVLIQSDVVLNRIAKWTCAERNAVDHWQVAGYVPCRWRFASPERLLCRLQMTHKRGIGQRIVFQQTRTDCVGES